MKRDEHIRKARLNLAFSRALDPIDQCRFEWKAIVLFYAAVHAVDAIVKKHRAVTYSSHQKRRHHLEALVPKHVPQGVFDDYVTLQGISEDARYEQLDPNHWGARDLRQAASFVERQLIVLALR